MLRTRRVGNAIVTAWTTVLAVAAAALICLGSEIAFSNMQTSSYSLGSIGWAAVYLLVVLGLPILVVKVLSRRGHPGGAHALRIASWTSLLLQLLFLPFLFVLSTM